MDDKVNRVKEQIIKKFNPIDIILFGSHAKGKSKNHSDIDICVVMETENKRKLIQEILIEVEHDVDLDVVIYTPAEWAKYKNDKTKFAHIVYKTGVSLMTGK